MTYDYKRHGTTTLFAALDVIEGKVFHFTPKSYSSLNAVEGFFSRLTWRRLKRGVFRLLRDNQDARGASIWMRKCRRMRDGRRA
jgi:hypothetical protein